MTGWSEKARAFIHRWQIVAACVAAVLGSLWYAVTRADDLMRKADKVPAIEEAILQLKVNQESGDRRLQSLEKWQADSERKSDRQNAEINDKLDKLLRGG